MSRKRHIKYQQKCKDDEEPQPFEVIFPKEGHDVTSGGDVELCVCKNHPFWDEDGAPSTVCPGDCAF